MKKTITLNIEEIPNTCFDCSFSFKHYCWANCPFLNTEKEDGEPTPKECPLKDKNKNKVYNFNAKIFY